MCWVAFIVRDRRYVRTEEASEADTGWTMCRVAYSFIVHPPPPLSIRPRYSDRIKYSTRPHDEMFSDNARMSDAFRILKKVVKQELRDKTGREESAWKDGRCMSDMSVGCCRVSKILLVVHKRERLKRNTSEIFERREESALCVGRRRLHFCTPNAS